MLHITRRLVHHNHSGRPHHSHSHTHSPLTSPSACPQVPLLCQLVPRQRKASAAVELIRQTTTDLIRKCKEMVDEEEMAAASQAEDYMNEADPSVLRCVFGGGGQGLGRAGTGLG